MVFTRLLRFSFSDVLLEAYFALVEKLVSIGHRYPIARCSSDQQYKTGARNFLFINVPPIQRCPPVRGYTDDRHARDSSYPEE